MPVDPNNQKMYRLTCLVPRIITALVLVNGKHQTLPDEYVLADLPAFSDFHARNAYWKHCPHIKPSLLDPQGKPLATRKLKVGDIRVRLKREDDPPIEYAPTPVDIKK
jgi:hypothetical protein